MKKFISGLIGLAILALPLTTALAQEVNIPTNLPDAVARIVGPLFSILIAISVIFLLYAGYTFVTAGGDASKIETARNTLIFAIIGIVVAFLSLGIYNLLKGL
jgi:uncharacterized membrane protein YozB (DUF420 family)